MVTVWDVSSEWSRGKPGSKEQCPTPRYHCRLPRLSLLHRHGSARVKAMGLSRSSSPSTCLIRDTHTIEVYIQSSYFSKTNCMRLLLSCLRPHLASTTLIRSTLIRRHLLVTMASSSSAPVKKQVKLDAFVKGNTGDGSSKGKAIDMTTTSSSNGKASSSSSSKTTANKRPRDDGTDVPVAAKKSKANGTYRAFPNGDPDPPEDTVEGLTSIMAKLEEVHKKAKPVKVCLSVSSLCLYLEGVLCVL